MSKIVTIGDINVDMFMPVEKLPLPGKQVTTTDFQMHGGGSSANFSLACARLGMDIRLFGKVGDDVLGRHVLISLEDNKVDTSNVLLTDKKTGVTIAMIQGIERTFITFRGENATYCLDDIDVSKISGDIVHFPSYFLMDGLRYDYIKLIEIIHAAGVQVSFDTGWDPRGFIDETMKPLLEILPKVDLFLPNIDEARNILRLRQDTTPKKVAEKLVEIGVKTAVVKLGEGGCWVANKDMVEYIPAFKVKVVDTTGAGDNFAAGFISAYIGGKTLRQSALIGSATAALKIGGVGWPAYPHRLQLNEFLHARRIEEL